MACFAEISVSQGSVATYARCGGTFDIHLTANLPRNLPVKNLLNRLRIDRIVVTSLWPHFCPPCTVISTLLTLRSSTQHLLTVPRCRTVVGARRFSVAAPEVWNSLPIKIRNCETLGTFKKHIKTHLFCQDTNYSQPPMRS